MSILPKDVLIHSLFSSWQEMYQSDIPGVVEFGTQLGNHLRMNKEVWLELNQVLIERQLLATNFLSLGSGLKPWLKEYFDRVNQFDLSNKENEITLIDYAFESETSVEGYRNYVQNYLVNQHPQFKDRNIKFNMNMIGGDIFTEVRQLSLKNQLPENLNLEIRSILSYLPWKEFKELLCTHILPRTDAIILVQQEVNNLRTLFHPDRIKDCREVDRFFDENGFETIKKVEIPEDRAHLDYAGLIVRRAKS